MKVTDLARVGTVRQVIGIRQAKNCEADDQRRRRLLHLRMPGTLKILPTINGWATCPKRIKDGVRVPEGFVYASDNNTEWMTDADLENWIEINRAKIGSI